MTEAAEQPLPPVPEDIEDMLKREQEEAPYGRKPDGTPRPKPGRKPGSRTRPGGPRRPPAAPPKRPGKAPASPDYKAAVEGLFQLPAGVLLMAGTQRKSVALQADAAALVKYGPEIAAALDQLAKEQPQVAALLEKVLQVGPYGALIVPAFALVLQLAANHKAIPPSVPGVQEPEVLIAEVIGLPPPLAAQEEAA